MRLLCRMLLCVCVFLFSASIAGADGVITLQNYNNQERGNTVLYNQSHPDNQVETLQAGFLTPTAAADQMANGSTMDIFTLLTFQQDFRSLIAGGELAPITSSIPLSDRVQEFLSAGGVLYAVPVNVNTMSCFSFTFEPDLLMQHGIDAASLPDNMLDLLCMLTDLYADGSLTGAKPFAFENPRMLLQTISADCAKYFTCNDENAQLFSSTITALLKQAELLLDVTEQVNAQQSELPSLFTVCDMQRYLADPEATMLQLVPMTGLAMRIPFSIIVAAVNDDSPKLKPALEYIAFEQSMLSDFEKQLLAGEETTALSHSGIDAHTFTLLNDDYGALVDSATYVTQIIALHNESITVEEFVRSITELDE